MYDLVSADYTVILSSSYREVQGMLGAVNHHSTIADMHINASKTKAMLAFIPGEQDQAIPPDGESLENIDKFKYLSSMFVQNGQGSGTIRSVFCNPFRILGLAVVYLVTA